MFDYIQAEFYKAVRRKYLYVTALCLCACAAILVAGYAFLNSNGNTISFYEGGGYAVTLLSIGLYATVVVGDIVFSDQYKHNTLKNEVSYGLPRVRIYLGKLVVEALIGAVLSVLVVALYEVLCLVLLIPSPPEAITSCLQMVGYSVLAALPQWFGIMALVNVCMFLVRNNTLGSFLALGILVIPNSFLQIICMTPVFRPETQEMAAKIMNWLPIGLVDNAFRYMNDWSYMGRSWLVGLLWIAVCTAIGLISFKRREIN